MRTKYLFGLTYPQEVRMQSLRAVYRVFFNLLLLLIVNFHPDTRILKTGGTGNFSLSKQGTVLSN